MEQFVKLFLDALVIGVFVTRGNTLTNRAYKHLLDPSKDLWFSPLSEANKFTDEGQASRRRALIHWRVGLLIVLVCFVRIAVA